MSSSDLPEIHEIGRLFDPVTPTPMISRGVKRLAALRVSTNPVLVPSHFACLWTFIASHSNVQEPSNVAIDSILLEGEHLLVYRRGRKYEPTEVHELSRETGELIPLAFDRPGTRRYFYVPYYDTSFQRATKAASELGFRINQYYVPWDALKRLPHYEDVYVGFAKAYGSTDLPNNFYGVCLYTLARRSSDDHEFEHQLSIPVPWEVELGLIDEEQDKHFWTRGGITYALARYGTHCVAVETETGRVLWRRGYRDSSFTVEFEDDELWIVDLWGGTVSWDEVPNQYRASVHTVGLAARTGEVRWSTSGKLIAVNTTNRVVIIRGNDTVIEGRDFDSGTVKWEQASLFRPRVDVAVGTVRAPYTPPVALSSRKYVFVSDGDQGQLVAIDIDTGSLVWSTTVDDLIISMAVDAGRLFVATATEVRAYSIPA